MLSQCIKNGDPGIGYGSTIRGSCDMEGNGCDARVYCRLCDLWIYSMMWQEHYQENKFLLFLISSVLKLVDLDVVQHSCCCFIEITHKDNMFVFAKCTVTTESRTNFYVASLTWNPSRRLNGWIQSRWDMELSTGTWRTEICMWSHIVFSAFANV